MNPPLHWIDMGTIPYGRCIRIQDELAGRRSELDGDYLLLAQHPPTYSFSPRLKESPACWSAEYCRRHGIEPVLTSRGGDPWYHSPGQISGYAVFDIARQNLSPRAFVALMQRALMLVLKDAGVPVFTRPAAAGLWVDGRQIAGTGVHLSRGVSRHGFFLNVAPDLSPAEFATADAVPGPAAPVTSLEKLGLSMTAEDIIPKIAAAFGVVFHQQVRRADGLPPGLTP